MAAESHLEAALASASTNLGHIIDDNVYDASEPRSSRRDLQQLVLVMYNGPCTDPETSYARSAIDRDLESDVAGQHTTNPAHRSYGPGEDERLGVDAIYNSNGSFVESWDEYDDSPFSDSASWILFDESLPSDQEALGMITRERDEYDELTDRDSGGNLNANQFESREGSDSDYMSTLSVTHEGHQRRRILPTDEEVLARIERDGPVFDEDENDSDKSAATATSPRSQRLPALPTDQEALAQTERESPQLDEIDESDEYLDGRFDPEELQPASCPDTRAVGTVPAQLWAEKADSENSMATVTSAQSRLPHALPAGQESGAETGCDGEDDASSIGETCEKSCTESLCNSLESVAGLVTIVSEWLDNVELEGTVKLEDTVQLEDTAQLEGTGSETGTVKFDDSKSASETGSADRVGSISVRSTPLTDVFIRIMDWLDTAATTGSEFPVSEIDGESCITITQTDRRDRQERSEQLFDTVSAWLNVADTDGGSEPIREIEWEDAQGIETDTESANEIEVILSSPNPKPEESDQHQLQQPLSGSRNGHRAGLDLGLFAALTVFYLILGCCVDVVLNIERDIELAGPGNAATSGDNVLWETAVAVCLAVLSIRIMHWEV